MISGQGTIPNDWDGEYCRYAVCWPNSPMWLAVLRGVLTMPSRGRFWDEHTGTITEAQAVIRETFDYNLHLRGVIMACNDDGLSEIAQAILALSNCCGEGGVGGITGTASSSGTEPPLNPIVQGDPATDDPPTGFDEWAEFEIYKCAIAHNILDLLEQSLEKMSIINLGVLGIGAIGLALEVAISLAVPPMAIVALATLLIEAGGQIIISTLLSLITEYRGELICALYNGKSAGQSLADFRSVLASFVSSDISDPITGFAVNTMAKYMVGNQEVNRLYEEDLTRNWAAQDCTDCEGCEALHFDFTENSTGGFEAEESIPDCLTQPLNGLLSLSSIDDVLTVVVNSGTPYPNAAFGQSGLEYPIIASTSMRLVFRLSGADDVYIEAVLVIDGGTCVSVWFTSSHPASEGFGTIDVPLGDYNESEINEVYIYLASQNPSNGGFTVEFQDIAFICT